MKFPNTVIENAVVPGYVTIIRKNTEGTPIINEGGMKNLRMVSASSPELIHQGNTSISHSGSISSVSESDHHVPTNDGTPRPEQPNDQALISTKTDVHDAAATAATAAATLPEEDLNSFFDDDFLLFMSDDPVSSTETTTVKILLNDNGAEGTAALFDQQEPIASSPITDQTQPHQDPLSMSPVGSQNPMQFLKQAPVFSSSSDEAEDQDNKAINESVPSQSSLSTPATSNVISAPISTSASTFTSREQSEKESCNAVANTVSVSIDEESLDENSNNDSKTRKRKNMTAEQKANGRRERNREHAKRSRKRKKVFVETLQEMIVQLKTENEKMRSCMTQHFGSQFVQDLLLSSDNNACTPPQSATSTSTLSPPPASVSPFTQALPTPSNNRLGFDLICPKLTPSHSSSSIHQNATSTTLSSSLHPNEAGGFLQIAPSSSQSLSTTTQEVAANARWLAEENIPKYLHRKKVMYKDKLSVLLPKHKNASMMRGNNQEADLLLMDTTMLNAAGGGAGMMNAAGDFVANPILSNAK